MKRFGITPAEQQAASAAKCREIVHEITNFGVTQDDVLAIIHLLSLELEDREQMKSISELSGKYRTNRLVQLDLSNSEENE